MSDRSRHHFVPRFYLRAFSSASERIHALNISRGRVLEHVALRGQCRRRHFYGPTPVLEDRLSALEDQAAPILRGLAESGLSPAPGSLDHWIVLNFVVLQWVRTAAAVRTTLVGLEKFRTFLSEGSQREIDPPSEREAAALTFSEAPDLLQYLVDLLPVVFRAPPNQRFITSDSPLCRFNSYCQEIRWRGVLGARQAGLQLILPLAPGACLMLIDPEVYLWLGEERRSPVLASERDVELLNSLQLLGAEENAYFSELRDAAGLLSLLGRLHRDPQRGVRAVEAANADNERDLLLHLFDALPDLRLRLSFLSERSWARKIPPLERRKVHRHSRTPEDQRHFTPLNDGKPHYFVVRREI